MSECGVCLGEFEGESVDLFQAVFLRARKPHTCYECLREIPPKAQYERIKMLYEGRWDTYHLCALCSEIGRRLSCDGSRTIGTLWEDIKEYVFPDMSIACLDKLQTPEAKERLRSAWAAWKL